MSEDYKRNMIRNYEEEISKIDKQIEKLQLKKKRIREQSQFVQLYLESKIDGEE